MKKSKILKKNNDYVSDDVIDISGSPASDTGMSIESDIEIVSSNMHEKIENSDSETKSDFDEGSNEKVNGLKEVESIYYVEKILDSKMVNGQRLFLLKWEGYSNEENSWEPEENVNSKELIDEYLALEEIKFTKSASLEKCVENDSNRIQIDQIETDNTESEELIPKKPESEPIKNKEQIEINSDDSNDVVVCTSEEPLVNQSLFDRIPALQIPKIDIIETPKVSEEPVTPTISVKISTNAITKQQSVSIIESKKRGRKRKNEKNDSEVNKSESDKSVILTRSSSLATSRVTRSKGSKRTNKTIPLIDTRRKRRKTEDISKLIDSPVEIDQSNSNSSNSSREPSPPVKKLRSREVSVKTNSRPESSCNSKVSVKTDSRPESSCNSKANSSIADNCVSSEKSQSLRRSQRKSLNSNIIVTECRMTRRRSRLQTGDNRSEISFQSKSIMTSNGNESVADSLDVSNLPDNNDSDKDDQSDNGKDSEENDENKDDQQKELNEDESKKTQNKTNKIDKNNGKNQDEEIEEMSYVIETEDKSMKKLKIKYKKTDSTSRLIPDDDDKADESNEIEEKKSVEDEDGDKEDADDDSNDEDEDEEKEKGVEEDKDEDEEDDEEDDDEEKEENDNDGDSESKDGDEDYETNVLENEENDDDDDYDEKTKTKHKSITKNNENNKGRRKSSRLSTGASSTTSKLDNKTDHNVYFPENMTQNVQEIFQVEKILRMRVVGKKRFFFLKWEGFPNSENTWEPEENLECPDLIEEFLVELAKRNSLLNAAATVRNSRVNHLKGCSKYNTAKIQNLKMKKLKQQKQQSKLLNDVRKVSNRKVKIKSGYSSPEELSERDVIMEPFQKMKKYGQVRMAERVIAAGIVDGRLMFLIKWKNKDLAHLVDAKRAYSECPQVCLRYFHERIFWRDPDGDVTEEYIDDLTFHEDYVDKTVDNKISSTTKSNSNIKQTKTKIKNPSSINASSASDIIDLTGPSQNPNSINNLDQQPISISTSDSVNSPASIGTPILNGNGIVPSTNNNNNSNDSVKSLINRIIAEVTSPASNNNNNTIIPNSAQKIRGRPPRPQQPLQQSSRSNVNKTPRFNLPTPRLPISTTKKSNLLDVIKSFQTRGLTPNSNNNNNVNNNPITSTGGAIRSNLAYRPQTSSVPSNFRHPSLPNIQQTTPSSIPTSSISSIISKLGMGNIRSSLNLNQKNNFVPPSPAPPGTTTTQYAPKEMPPPSPAPSPAPTTQYAPKEIPPSTPTPPAQMQHSTLQMALQPQTPPRLFPSPQQSQIRPANIQTQQQQRSQILIRSINDYRGVQQHQQQHQQHQQQQQQQHQHQQQQLTNRSPAKQQMCNILLNNIHNKSQQLRNISISNPSPQTSATPISSMRNIHSANVTPNNILAPTTTFTNPSQYIMYSTQQPQQNIQTAPTTQWSHIQQPQQTTLYTTNNQYVISQPSPQHQYYQTFNTLSFQPQMQQSQPQQIQQQQIQQIQQNQLPVLQPSPAAIAVSQHQQQQQQQQNINQLQYHQSQQHFF